MSQNQEPLTVTQGPAGTEVPADELSKDDRAALGAEDWIVVEEISKGGVKLTAKKHAGVVGLPSGRQLEISPKIDCNLLYLLAYVGRLSEDVVRGMDASISVEGRFIDVVASLFVDELQKIIQRGLFESYQRVSSDERYVRGRLDLTQQVTQHGPVASRFACEYDELTHDVTLNHAVYCACEQLLPLVADQSIRDSLRRNWDQLRSYLEVNPHQLTADVVREIELTRLNDHYERILTLSVLVLESSYFDSIGAGPRQFDRLLIDMRNLFEHVVFRGFSEAFSDHQVRVEGDGSPPERSAKPSIGYLLADSTESEAPGRTSVQKLKPDIFVTTTDREPEILLVGDAKWKDPSSKPSRDDLFQLNAYQSYAGTPGVLVYPDIGDEVTTYRYQSAGERGLRDEQLSVIGLSCSEATSYKEFQHGVERAIRQAATQALE